jgi:hypothetical protein
MMENARGKNFAGKRQRTAALQDASDFESPKIREYQGLV